MEGELHDEQCGRWKGEPSAEGSTSITLRYSREKKMSRRKIGNLLNDLSQTRDRLDHALKDGALQRQLVAESCRVLRETLQAVQEGRHIAKKGLPQKAPAPHSFDGIKRLTAREIEVLRLIAEGLSTKEIAH